MSLHPMNISSLYETRINLINSHKNAYDQILSMCFKTIKSYNDHKKFECYYSAPTFLSGHSLYKYEDLLEYMIDSLRELGFNAYWNSTVKKIYVSWKPDDIDYSKAFAEKEGTRPSARGLQGLTIDNSEQQPVARLHYNGSKSSSDKFPINIKHLKK